jgi:hypothetical protein
MPHPSARLGTPLASYGAATIGSGQRQCKPMTYFITFACYGSHMHGAGEGSVDLNHNHYGAPLASQIHGA